MIPADLHEFLIACVGASASFIGLLFVGLSFVLQRAETNSKLANNDRLQAQSAFTALINIFFVTLAGLVPGINIGTVILVLALLGLLGCYRLRSFSGNLSLAISALVYLAEAVFGFYVLGRNELINVDYFQIIMFALLALSLYRSWELTGLRRHVDS